MIYGPPASISKNFIPKYSSRHFPKIKVNFTPGRMSEVISRIMAEQRAGIRQADLVLGGTDILLGTLKKKDFFNRFVRRYFSPKYSTPALGSKANFGLPTRRRNLFPCGAPCPTPPRASIPV